MTIDRNDKQLTKGRQSVSRFNFKSAHERPYPSVIGRFVQRIKQTFQYLNHSRSGGLSGRAQAILPRIDVLIDQLKSIENTMGDYYLYRKYIALPLIREGTKLREEIITSGKSISHQLSSHYILWIDRSYRWLDLFYKYEPERLNKAVIDEIIEDSQGRVEKDLHLVSDYIEQQLGSLDFTDKVIDTIRESIKHQLQPTIDAIKGVESTYPLNRSPEVVHRWRENLHVLRQKFFDQCLEIVDSVIEIKTPRKKSREKKRYLVKTLDGIISLENAVEDLRLYNEGYKSEVVRRHLKRKVAALYQQAHQISLDIRLSQELFDRLQVMMHQLSKAYEKLP